MNKIADDAKSQRIAKDSHVSVDWVSLAPVLFFLVLILGFTVAEPQYFATVQNATTIMNDGAILAILACGLTIVLIVGEFDLSIAAVASLSGAVSAVLITQFGWPVPLTLLVALVAGLLIGILNGVLVVRLEIPALVATIGSASVLDGLTLWITGNSVIFEGFENNFLNYGNWRIAGVQAPFFYLVLIASVLMFALRYTTTGRHLYAVGGNRQASRMSGIMVDHKVISAFAACSTLAAFAGFVYTARQGSLTPLFGTPLLLPAFAAAFLGSVTLVNRRFHILGTIIGVYIIGTGTIGFLLIGAPAYTQQLFSGAVLLLATGGSKLIAILRN